MCPHHIFITSIKGPKYHEVMWFNLEKTNVPSVCSLCGQVFKLVDAGVNDPAAAGMVTDDPGLL